MTQAFNNQIFTFTRQLADNAFKAQSLALQGLSQVAALQLEALEKQAAASAQFIGEAVETRDVDGLRTLWEKGANLSRSNAEQAVALSQEVLAITQKTAESVSALVQEQRQAANDAVASPIVTGRKVSSAK